MSQSQLRFSSLLQLCDLATHFALPHQLNWHNFTHKALPLSQSPCRCIEVHGSLSINSCSMKKLKNERTNEWSNSFQSPHPSVLPFHLGSTLRPSGASHKHKTFSALSAPTRSRLGASSRLPAPCAPHDSTRYTVLSSLAFLSTSLPCPDSNPQHSLLYHDLHRAGTLNKNQV